MGRFEGNCPSEEFLHRPPFESFIDMKSKIEILFGIKIQSEYDITKEMIVTNPEEIKIVENYFKRFKGRRDFSGDRPSYDPKSGYIIIPEKLYNERSLIHETLHAFSNLTLRKLVNRYYDLGFNIILREGITEFLTGCILFRYYPNCYVYFKKPSSYGNLELGYREKGNPKFWFVFTQIFGIAIILRIYFEKNLKIETYNDIYTQLIGKIRNLYPNFEVINPSYSDSWQNGLIRVSKEFKTISTRIDKVLDFSVFSFL